MDNQLLKPTSNICYMQEINILSVGRNKLELYTRVVAEKPAIINILQKSPKFVMMLKLCLILVGMFKLMVHSKQQGASQDKNVITIFVMQ